jgi:hypothetical protein
MAGLDRPVAAGLLVSEFMTTYHDTTVYHPDDL